MLSVKTNLTTLCYIERDDSYLMHSLGEGDTHFHPESPKVFRPTKLVPKALREKLKAKYEDMLRLYGAN